MSCPCGELLPIRRRTQCSSAPLRRTFAALRIRRDGMSHELRLLEKVRRVVHNSGHPSHRWVVRLVHGSRVVGRAMSTLVGIRPLIPTRLHLLVSLRGPRPERSRGVIADLALHSQRRDARGAALAVDVRPGGRPWRGGVAWVRLGGQRYWGLCTRGGEEWGWSGVWPGHVGGPGEADDDRERVRWPNSCREVARHTPRKSTPVDSGWLRTCPRVPEKLLWEPKVAQICLPNSAQIRQFWPSWAEFGQIWPMVGKH